MLKDVNFNLLQAIITKPEHNNCYNMAYILYWLHWSLDINNPSYFLLLEIFNKSGPECICLHSYVVLILAAR